jgi:hypothetical protein
MKNALHFRLTYLSLLLLLGVGLRQPASAQQPDTPLRCSPQHRTSCTKLGSDESRRAQALRAYQGIRVYRVEYRGFPGTRSAEMVVDVKYQSPGKEEFTIQSATGSKLIIDRVLKKLLQSEKEALEADMQRRTALNNDNYDFILIGSSARPRVQCTCLQWSPEPKISFSTAVESG